MLCFVNNWISTEQIQQSLKNAYLCFVRVLPVVLFPLSRGIIYPCSIDCFKNTSTYRCCCYSNSFHIFIISALYHLSRLVTLDCFVMPSVQQKLKATIVNPLCCSPHQCSLSKFKVQYYIPVCHWTLFNIKESERARQKVLCHVRNLFQRKSLIQCKCCLPLTGKNYAYIHNLC